MHSGRVKGLVGSELPLVAASGTLSRCAEEPALEMAVCSAWPSDRTMALRISFSSSAFLYLYWKQQKQKPPTTSDATWCDYTIDYRITSARP